MSIRVLPAATRLQRRWKNNGGVTYEIMSFPVGSGLDDFSWRLSMAKVAKEGPFSSFPGVDRHLAVVQGTLELDIHGQKSVFTLKVGQNALHFPGDVEVHGLPVSDAVIDLNLMVRRGVFCGSLLSHAGLSDIEARQGPVIVLLLESSFLSDGQKLQLWDAIYMEVGEVLKLKDPARAIIASIKPV